LALPRYDHIIERRAVAFEVDVLDEEQLSTQTAGQSFREPFHWECMEIAIALILGFAFRCGVRDWVSQRRRHESQRRGMEWLPQLGRAPLRAWTAWGGAERSPSGLSS
jgi:hypothetical protein